MVRLSIQSVLTLIPSESGMKGADASGVWMFTVALMKLGLTVNDATCCEMFCTVAAVRSPESG